MNRKKLYRLYREERLMVRRRRGRKRALGTRAPMTLPRAINQRWSLDFVSDMLSDGRRFRILCVVDDFSRECLATVVDTSLGGVRVVRELEQLGFERSTPRVIVSDNVLRRQSRSPLEQGSPVAWGARGFSNRAHQRLGASSLRCGAPSRVRWGASPADAALDGRHRFG